MRWRKAASSTKSGVDLARELFEKAENSFKHSFSDEKAIRRTALAYRIPCITTMAGAKAAAEAVAARRRGKIRVWSLQEIHATKGERAVV